jgi:hypothetical protein
MSDEKEFSLLHQETFVIIPENLVINHRKAKKQYLFNNIKQNNEAFCREKKSNESVRTM